ncbi:MAG: mannose-1-phosphate guanylyltransferase/mannose-6-phosphate isomerase [Nitrospiraceae bacterium]|nr:mannose-1-phosphate guanylyltransferase/mannose-6-phosphate isomerase [Nitrospiraceae bacterium]
MPEKDKKTDLIPVILCGGAGTRLWPMSREKHPKQLLAIKGSSTLLQDTVRRSEGFSADRIVCSAPIVVCNEEYRFLIAEQIRETGVTPSDIMLEPVGRNTAPALTVAALHAYSKRDSLLLVMPSDHVIEDNNAFQKAVQKGMDAALSGSIVTFGILPDRPETGYGYIEAGAGDGVCKITRFVEKPDIETAKKYVSSGNYYWNSGIFMLLAGTWIKAIKKYRPDIYEACIKAYESGSRDLDFYRIDRAAFSSCPSDSIDYAVMEKLGSEPDSGISAAVVPLSAGWSDVGAWDAVWGISQKDADGNVVSGDVILDGAYNSLIHSGSRLVACVGVNDLVVIETPDAVLVAKKDRVQDVKSVVSRLAKSKRSEGVAHRKAYRPWGWYDGVDSGERFQVKRICVKPGASLSLQMHHHRAEHWVVVKGTARIIRGDETILLSENESTYIPLGVKHRLENPGMVPLEMIEVQSGPYLGEDDIVRFDDVYGRKDTK